MSNKDTTLDKVITLIKNSGVTTNSSISSSSNLYDDLEFDSLDAVEFVMTIEDEFGVTISDDELSDLKTVQDVVNYIDKNSD